MNLSYFIAQRIKVKQGNGFSSTIHQIAVASIAIGLAIILVSFLIFGGFKKTISDKVFNLAGHYQVSKYTLVEDFEEPPISKRSEFYEQVGDYPFVSHVQTYAHKAGLLKGEEEVDGVILKGVEANFDTLRFQPLIQSGRMIDFSDSNAINQIVLSEKIANRMQLAVGDRVLMYFVQDPPRFRRLTVVGIYNSALEEFDNRLIIGHLDLIRRLNGWSEDQVGGYEVFINQAEEIEARTAALVDILDFDLKLERSTDKYMEIFDWLTLIGRNVRIFLVLIVFVACFNMVSILFILIMERTQMIGLLKSMGATHRLISRIFVFNGVKIVLKGLLIGNVIGLGFGLLQDQFRLIPLDPANYYMTYVPIAWDWVMIIALNVLVFTSVALVQFLPTVIISGISPIKAIKFD